MLCRIISVINVTTDSISYVFMYNDIFVYAIAIHINIFQKHNRSYNYIISRRRSFM